jgi:hypothetical protein
MKHCPHGHPQTADNVETYRHGARHYARCRVCHRQRLNAKYRHDAAWRERQKSLALKRYYDRQEQHA